MSKNKLPRTKVRGISNEREKHESVKQILIPKREKFVSCFCQRTKVRGILAQNN